MTVNAAWLLLWLPLTFLTGFVWGYLYADWDECPQCLGYTATRPDVEPGVCTRCGGTGRRSS